MKIHPTDIDSVVERFENTVDVCTFPYEDALRGQDVGIAVVLDPNEAALFVAMTRDNAVWRLPFMKDGSVSKVGRFCSLFGPSGPDGVTMDRAGRLFVAHASLGHVFVFAPNGECIARIKSCAGQSCTNVAIGGANADRLYITESATGTVLVADISQL